MDVAGSVLGGLECEAGLWNAEGEEMGGGTGEGIILEATFQKSSKLSIPKCQSRVNKEKVKRTIS
jgi:hypothetical protein